MEYVLFDHTLSRPHVSRRYNSHRAAMTGMRAANRKLGLERTARINIGAMEGEVCVGGGIGTYVVMEATLFDIRYPRGTKVVKNLMTGEDVTIPEDTPWCCDPSSETYWST